MVSFVIPHRLHLGTAPGVHTTAYLQQSDEKSRLRQTFVRHHYDSEVFRIPYWRWWNIFPPKNPDNFAFQVHQSGDLNPCTSQQETSTTHLLPCCQPQARILFPELRCWDKASTTTLQSEYKFSARTQKTLISLFELRSFRPRRRSN